MGRYNFDEIIDRSGTSSSKHTFNPEKGLTPDLIPLWVADMDFKSPDAVIERLIARAQHGVFGYTAVSKEYEQAIQKWFEKRFDWHVEPEWMVRTHGVVTMVSAAIQALTEEGDAVMIQNPVYYPFHNSVVAAKRRSVSSDLVLKDGRYYIDFENFEKTIVEENVKLFVLCSPHNPVSRVWTKEELIRMGEICLKHNVIVVSDEIHCDFVYPGHKHYPFASLREDFAQNCVVCTAPSKTFNLAGLQTSNAFVPNEEMRKKIQEYMGRHHLGGPTIFGMTACQAAYECGEEWLEELLVYLQENARKVTEFFAENCPQIKPLKMDGTYLMWLDCRELPIPDEEVDQFMQKKAKVWFDDGCWFSSQGAGFERMNLGSPWPVLEEACKRIAAAVKEL